jgi:protein SCO1/2
MNQKLFILVILLLTGTLLWMSLAWKPHDKTNALTDSAIALKAPPAGGDFTVSSADGSINLADFRGKVVLLYFGYTLCPDVCPTSLGLISTALRLLPESKLSDVKVLFISVDPKRDSVEHLKTYAAYFHPTIIGATDTKENIDKIVAQYGASYRFTESDSDLQYLVDHTSSTYLINRDGKLINHLPHATPPADIVLAIEAVLANE